MVHVMRQECSDLHEYFIEEQNETKYISLFSEIIKIVIDPF